MSISGHIDDDPPKAGHQREARRRLSLEVEGAVGSGLAANVRVHNISATGLLIECDAPLAAGEGIAVDLPHAGPTPATVVWQSGQLHGCRFDEPVSTATLSAAQLRSAVIEPLDLGAEGEGDESFGMRLRRLRRSRGMTLDQIAAQVGVSKPTVWAWEQDKARPIDSRLADLALVLGVSVSALDSGQDASGLSDLLARCRRDIAKAARVTAARIRIMIEL